jgi:hydroxylamine reductase (hybrid-cluster protein)
MKPSQRIYQQRDIAQNKADYYAELIANELAGIVTNEEITDEEIDKSSKVSERWALEYIKWRTITKTLSNLGGRASNEEQQERKAREKAHEVRSQQLREAILKEIEEKVVEEKTQEDTRNNLVNPFGDYVQRQMDAYLSTTTNTVTLNTSLPPVTTGATYTFTIPRFKVAPPVEMKWTEEEDVEGII